MHIRALCSAGGTEISLYGGHGLASMERSMVRTDGWDKLVLANINLRFRCAKNGGLCGSRALHKVHTVTFERALALKCDHLCATIVLHYAETQDGLCSRLNRSFVVGMVSGLLIIS